MFVASPGTSALDAATLLDLELDGICLIEASAGTGKTHTLADLYLRQVLAGHRTDQILVVTYTNAATDELRGRVRARLYGVLELLEGRGAPRTEFDELLCARYLAEDATGAEQWLNRLRYALRTMDEAAISTIHAFCQRCLQDHAVAGGQFFDSDLIADDDELWDAALKDWWRARIYPLDDAAARLVEPHLATPDDLLDILLELRRKPMLRLLPSVSGGLDDFVADARRIGDNLAALAPIWRAAAADLGATLRESKALSRAKDSPYNRAAIEALLAAAEAFFDNPATLPFVNFERLAATALRAGSTPSKAGSDPRLEHEYFAAVDPLAAAWKDLDTQIGAWLIADAYRDASRRVAETKWARATFSFQDQLTLLRDALDGDRGAVLAEALRRQFPVAMVDEFQDTDPVQYRIFERIYQPDSGTSLTLIGDPKQAIYSFRGGDIFTYMQARRMPAVRHYGLRTNWRSQPELVRAINALFTRRAEPFVFGDAIEFTEIGAAPGNQDFRLCRDNEPLAALTLWQLPRDERGRPFSRDRMRDLVNRALVGEIATLLDDGARGAVRFGERPLASGDIAILVRKAYEGQALARELRHHGIPAVSIGRDTVFDSDEAAGLYDLLLAIAHFHDPVIARRSLASALLGFDYRRIAAIVDADDAWQAWLEDLATLRETWEQRGFIAMFQQLLQRLRLAPELAARAGSERHLTNLLHLAELLHRQSASTTGIEPLLAWLREQIDDNHDEEAELRLESDAALVKIVTIHKAKGLQYPVVFAPFLWSCNTASDDIPVLFHDAGFEACADFGSAELERHRRLADRERLAEDLRLLYVALTRAQAKAYLAWGEAGSANHAGHAGQTALAYLLHSKQTPADLENAPADGLAGDVDIGADLDALVETGGGSIERIMLPDAPPAAALAGTRRRAAVELTLANLARERLGYWRIGSFTALTRGVHQPVLPISTSAAGDPVLEFAAGSQVGVALHALLEHLDFTADLDAQCDALFPRFLPAAGIAGAQAEASLRAWLGDILRTPLDGESLHLETLVNRQRLNELEFDFALDRFDIAAVDAWLQARSPEPLLPLDGGEFGGLITGVIDLVFEYRGRYYLADYKSNLLGARLEDYAPARLAAAMRERRYDLQAMLYALALHRYLGHRLADYRYDRDFGGCYYLFLRGLRPDLGNRSGVYFERPSAAELEELDALLAFTASDARRPA